MSDARTHCFKNQVGGRYIGRREMALDLVMRTFAPEWLRILNRVALRRGGLGPRTCEIIRKRWRERVSVLA